MSGGNAGERKNPNSELFKVKVLALFHDPPWKPWALGVAKYYEIETKGSKERTWYVKLGEVAKETKELLSRLRSSKPKNLKELFDSSIEFASAEGVPQEVPSPAEDERFVEFFEKFSQAVEKTLEHIIEGDRPEKLRKFLEEGSNLKAHEYHAKFFLAIAVYVAKFMGFHELYRELDEVLRSFGGSSALWDKVKEADAFASTIDRTLLRIVYGLDKLSRTVDKSSRDRSSSSHPPSRSKDNIFVNPFNPKFKIRVEGNLSPNLIAAYVLSFLAALFYSLYLIQKNGKKVGLKEFYHFAFSLMEPTWYYVVRRHPPADTRVPHHTVFDHINATLAMVNWVHSKELKGLYVLVQIPSAQTFIEGSRRIRDLWASSWLLSYFSWLSVKRFVEEYGPDVLARPPARFHPFYSSYLISSLTGGRAPEGSELFLARLLGLPKGWPIDPTVPNKNYLILPPVDEGKLRELIFDEVEKGWSRLLDLLTTYLDSFFKPLASLDEYKVSAREREQIIIAKHFSELKEILKTLETPFAISYSYVKVDEVYKEVRALVERFNWNSDTVSSVVVDHEDLRDTVAKAVLFDYLQTKLKGERSRIGSKVGNNYLKLAKRLYDLGVTGSCHVCGTGIPIVDGRAVKEIKKSLGEHKIKFDRDKYGARVLVNIFSEKLCPYCLIKRMMRDLLKDNGRQLVGLEMPESVYVSLGRYTIDLQSSRRQLAYEEILKHVIELLEKAAKSEELIQLVMWREYTAPVPVLKPEDFEELSRECKKKLKKLGELGKKLEEKLGKKGEELGEELVRAAESLVSQAAHNKNFVEESEIEGELADALRKVQEDKEIWKFRRVTATIIADGDKMGSGVISGRLGITPAEYAKEIFNIDDKEIHMKLVKLFKWTVKEYERALKRSADEGLEVEGKSLVTTPSYYYTVSRALAAQAMLDRELVEAFGGVLIYAGGDDLRAVVPPVLKVKSEEKSEERLYSALALSEGVRRSYWGEKFDDFLKDYLEKLNKGWLNQLSGAKGEGFNDAPYSRTSYPALRAFGRSLVLYYFDVKYPMWYVMKYTHKLIESKDKFKAYFKDKELYEKDLFVVASTFSVSAALPFTDHRGSAKAPESVIGVLTAIDRGYLSSSYLNDIEIYFKELCELAGDAAGYDIVKYLLRRNLRNTSKEVEVERLLSRSFGHLWPSVLGRLEDAMRVKFGTLVPSNELAALLSRAECCETGEGERKDILLLPAVEIVRAARTTKMAW